MNYKIEGGIDFYSELNKEDETGADEITCLITNLPLLPDSVKLECGHQFNYRPLYTELVKQMCPTSMWVSKSGKISCPYCRKCQTNILPPNPLYKPVFGVNIYPLKVCDLSAIHLMPGGVCSLLLDTCSTIVYKLSNNTCFCLIHKSWGVSKMKQEELYKAFLIKETAKKEAQEKKHKKETAKKEAQEKKSAKEMAKKEAVQQLCQQLLKTGPRKGQACNCAKIIINTTTCLRHIQKLC